MRGSWESLSLRPISSCSTREYAVGPREAVHYTLSADVAVTYNKIWDASSQVRGQKKRASRLFVMPSLWQLGLEIAVIYPPVVVIYGETSPSQ
jgi:hypothetical protein